MRTAIGVGDDIGRGQTMCYDDCGAANHFIDEVTNQIGEGFSGVVNDRTIRDAVAQQVDDVNVEVLCQHIDVLSPFVGGSTWAKVVDEQQRPGIAVSFDLIEYFSVLP